MPDECSRASSWMNESVDLNVTYGHIYITWSAYARSQNPRVMYVTIVPNGRSLHHERQHNIAQWGVVPSKCYRFSSSFYFFPSSLPQHNTRVYTSWAAVPGFDRYLSVYQYQSSFSFISSIVQPRTCRKHIFRLVWCWKCAQWQLLKVGRRRAYSANRIGTSFFPRRR